MSGFYPQPARLSARSLWRKSSSAPRKQKQKNLGFTLIEMLVSVGVLLVITGGGIAAYLNFSTKEKVLQSGRDVIFLARAAQKKARVGDKPATCTRLLGYEMQLVSNTIIALRAVCSNGNFETQRKTLPTGITLSTGNSILFYVLHGGASSTQNYTVTDGTTSFRFTVGTGGDISEGAVL